MGDRIKVDSARARGSGSGRRRLGRPRHGRAVARHLPRDEEILHIAADVLYKNGFDATIEEIASAAGLVRRSFYNYFRSKDEVYERILDQISQRAKVPRAGRDRTRPAVERLRATLNAHVEMVLTFLVECGLLTRLMKKPGRLGDLARRRAKVAERETQALIAECQKEGAIPKDDDPAILCAITTGIHQQLPEWCAGRGLDPEVVGPIVTNYMLRGLGVASDKES